MIMPGSPDDTTLVLLRAAQAGDARATNQLFERYRDRLLQVVSLLLGKRRSWLLEDEEDLVQDTLLKAFQNLGGFTPNSEGALLHWLSRMAENNLRDAVRRQRSLKRGEGRVRPRVDFSSAFLMSSIYPGGEPTPSQVAERNELVEQVDRVDAALRRVELSLEQTPPGGDRQPGRSPRGGRGRRGARRSRRPPKR